MNSKEKRDFFVVVVALLLFVFVVNSLQTNDAERFQNYLEDSSPTAQVVSLDAPSSIRAQRQQTTVSPATQKQAQNTPQKENKDEFIRTLTAGNIQTTVLTSAKQAFVNALLATSSRSLFFDSQPAAQNTQDKKTIFTYGSYIPSQQQSGAKKSFVEALYQRGGK